MEIGLRILALVIDLVICFTILPVILSAATPLSHIIPDSAEVLSLLFIPLFFLLVILWPFIYFAVPTGMWGRTLGKFICRLKVSDYYDEKPGFWCSLGREVLKFLVIGSGIGVIITLFLYFNQGSTWYDQLCGTKVEFKPYIRLTKTQKNYRKYMKQRERLNR